MEIKSKRFDNMVKDVQEFGRCPVSTILKVYGGKWKPKGITFAIHFQ
jgi:hypothetical protein